MTGAWGYIDSKLSSSTHQILGVCVGIILCSWITGAPSESVAVIRLPATIIASLYLLAIMIEAAKRAYRTFFPKPDGQVRG
jgi:hypothetical protein